MKRRASAVLLLVLGVVAVAAVASAQTRRASIGNYWYEDEANGDRSKLVVRKGDQIVFTVREGVYPPHTVDVDELNIHSPGLLLGETYTTPALNKVGTFRLYCRPHAERGHVTRLIVQAAPTSTSTPAGASAGPGATAPPVAAVTPPPPAASATPPATLAPVGVGKASREELERPIAVDPDSLEGLTGRARSTQPWTRAVWFLVIAAVPILGVAIAALRMELVREGARRGTSPSSPGPKHSPSRSPRSSGRKASASGRTSRGRRR